MNFFKKNAYYFVFILLFFVFFWIFDRNFNENKIDEIIDNMGLTVAITKGFSHAATTCHIVYEYKVNGNAYLGQTACVKEIENCKKFLLAYSKVSPLSAIILLDFKIDSTIPVGANLDIYRRKVNASILNKWIKKQPTILNDEYKTSFKNKKASFTECN